MAKKISQAAIQNAIGHKLGSHPREDYQQSAHAVWYVMRESVKADAQPQYEDGRMGHPIVGTGPVQAIELLWPSLSDAEVSSARGQVVNALRKRNAAHVISQGRRNTPSVWWVAETFEPPEEATQPPEQPARQDEPMPEDQPIQTPTDWAPAHNGKEVPALALTEQSVPGDSFEDRLNKAFDIIRDVVTEVREENASLTAANKVLTEKLDIVSRAYRSISD